MTKEADPSEQPKKMQMPCPSVDPAGRESKGPLQRCRAMISCCSCYCSCPCFIVWWDREEGWGACSKKLPPYSRQMYPHWCAHVSCRDSLGDLTFHFHFHLNHAVPFLVSGTAGQDPSPMYQSFHLLYRYALPSDWHSFGIKMSFICHACLFAC